MIHDLEEIPQSAFSEGVADGQCAFAFAKAVVTDVGMRHVFIVAGRIGVGSDHRVAQSVCAVGIEFNAERAEVNVFQRDRIGDHRNRFASEIAIGIGILAVEPQQLFVEFPERRGHDWLLVLVGQRLRQTGLEFPQGLLQPRTDALGCG